MLAKATKELGSVLFVFAISGFRIPDYINVDVCATVEDYNDEIYVLSDHLVAMLLVTFSLQVITIICIAVWAINIGHFNDPSHGGSWMKVRFIHT